MNKNEKQKLEPKLRFPEFTSMDEWHNYRLEEISDRITERVGDKELPTLSISAGIGFVSQEQKFSRDISGKQYKNYIHIKKGDFSYNKGNSKKFPQGCIYELLEYAEAAVPNAFISFRFKYSYVSGFYKGYFENNFHGRQLVKYITSGARMDGLLNINPSDFFNIILPTPIKKEEQQKIADCLSSIDDLISAEEKKLSLLNDYKKGWMQKLFPAEGKTVPEWRFPEFKDDNNWKCVEIEMVGKVITGKTPPTSNDSLWNGSIQFVTPTDIVGDKYQRLVQRTVVKTSKMKVLPKGTIMFTCIASIGKMAISVYPCVTNQQINSIITNKGYYNESIYYSLFRNVNKIKSDLSNTTVPIINKTDFSKIQIFVTLNEKEQEKIANFLSGIDELISSQKGKIEKLKQHKKALMQGLFPAAEEVCK